MLALAFLRIPVAAGAAGLPGIFAHFIGGQPDSAAAEVPMEWGFFARPQPEKAVVPVGMRDGAGSMPAAPKWPETLRGAPPGQVAKYRKNKTAMFGLLFSV